MQDSERLKREAARRALELVRPGMKLGLGSGSTARHFVDLLGERVRAGLAIVGVPTSEGTATQARALGVPLATLEDHPELDLTIDGADQIDGKLRLIKGGGGALLREKIVAAASKRMLVIADASKYAEPFGAFPLPVEVAPFGLGATRRHIERISADLGLSPTIVLRPARGGGGAFLTDGGHYIVDCAFGPMANPAKVARELDGVVGVVEHGLFLGFAEQVFVGGPGGVKVLKRAVAGKPRDGAKKNAKRSKRRSR